MIRLDVQEYCHNCIDFEPDVQAPEKLYMRDPFTLDPMSGPKVKFSDTVVRCAHRNRCAAIKRYLEKESKKNEHE